MLSMMKNIYGISEVFYFGASPLGPAEGSVIPLGFTLGCGIAGFQPFW